MEKLIAGLITVLIAALGWFIREMLDGIRDRQKEHSTSLTNIRQHVIRTEDKVSFLQTEMTRMKETLSGLSATQRETKANLDHSLYEMRQQIKEQADEQYEQKQNFGKVILIVQKLYAQLKNGSSR